MKPETKKKNMNTTDINKNIAYAELGIMFSGVSAVVRPKMSFSRGLSPNHCRYTAIELNR